MTTEKGPVGDLVQNPAEAPARHEFVTLAGQRYACIRNVDHLAPFLMSIVSDSDAWLFVGSNSPFTAGRVDPDGAMFPYQTVDKLLRHADGGGSLSAFRVRGGGSGPWVWEPWRSDSHALPVTRNLYKHVLGTNVLFEEINHELGLRFTWSLSTCAQFGLVRHAVLENIGSGPVRVDYLDGFQMLLPPGVGEESYARLSYLAGAYMRHEVLPDVPLAIYTLNSAMEDKPLPYESLRATGAWSVGHLHPEVNLSDRSLRAFRAGEKVAVERELRGDFGSYLVADGVDLEPGERHCWFTVADTALDHARLVLLRDRLAKPNLLEAELHTAVSADRQSLRRLVAAADGLQETADEAATVHHFGSVLFNCMRGGTFLDSYRFPRRDLDTFLRAQNAPLHARMEGWLASLPETISLASLRSAVEATGDAQLIRLCGSYLPLMYSRRHGDPSRPWNRFSIHVRGENGEPVYGYQGNWRDIFQNWETLAQSFPGFLEQMLAVFLNASTADGYNPYRIGRDGGIDWEVADPDDPWGHFGYWGDHQIVYLLRLLESEERFRPGALASWLNRREYSYANVPYRIAGLDATLADPRTTITFDVALHRRLLAAAAEVGADAKLVADSNGDVLLVSLAEKLLVPLLVKLTNFIPDGGTWLNAQRPEWNDANNALAGWGLSMVTVAHARRYLRFCERVFTGSEPVELSEPLAVLVERLTAIYGAAPVTFDDTSRYEFLVAAGRAGEEHRRAVYAGGLGTRRSVPMAALRELVGRALPVLERAILVNRRDDGLYHGYNLLHVEAGQAHVTHLFPMLEGQAAVLGSGLLAPAEALAVLRALRSSDLYRADQNSYLLYPDLALTPFLHRNTIASVPPLDDPRVFVRDSHGQWHFQADLRNANDLAGRLDAMKVDEQVREATLDLWETVFRHREFTGRSRTFFMFEGLGSIYWHMVAKLLVSVLECYQAAIEPEIGEVDVDAAAALADAYDHVRDGLGFRKSAAVQGAFPCDPYSHTPRDRGAQQPGMTGLVKEEVLARWGELGVQVRGGRLRFAPRLLHRAEFEAVPHRFDYVDIAGQDRSWELSAGSLAFTYCGTPVCYELADRASVLVDRVAGPSELIAGDELPRAASESVFARDGSIVRLIVRVPREALRLLATEALPTAQSGRNVDRVFFQGLASSATRSKE
ncbi:MAG: hypothetical protein ABSA21_01345 [Candidatus Limnocylindrales bacterium]